ncbi:methylthioribose-1-phosphate isomerase [Cimex lectularius]|uniref:Methylthioribose-1-phosphate isomerase n=1 Tax=Cimex lectularius TaxID=79782 RepID=A0A8I6TJB0_CIMLE|nr:methylthioribose-1-phosphate isomerase [Cimex lectularius]
MPLQAIKYKNGRLEILDQLLLPQCSKYTEIKNVSDGWNAIKSMNVRGAPAIAIVGCLSLAVELRQKNFNGKQEMLEEITKKLEYQITSRPTAVNMAKEADGIIKLCEQLNKDDKVDVETMKNSLLAKIEAMLEEDIFKNKEIGRYGADAILSTCDNKKKLNVLTHCNTGTLATAGYGTALGVIRRLHELQAIERAYCTETRPYMQGSRLTAYELVYEKIPSTLICDSAVAALFKEVNISAVVVGADRVAANGDTANKIGTYQLAVLCHYHGIPFYVCSPLSTIDFTMECGKCIKIEERPDAEMTDVLGKRIAAPGIKCWNPAFDVTPASLITGIITEKGVFKPENLKELQGSHKM